MISNACTRMDMGASAGSVPPVAQPSLICGDSDDVIQVSITSGSGSRSPEPQDGQTAAGGWSTSGSTGRSPVRVLPDGDEPLRPDLELDWGLAPLVHPDDLPHRLAADRQPSRIERLDDGRTRLRQPQSGELPGQRPEPPVRLDHQAQREP